jgi:hypothetical protein
MATIIVHTAAQSSPKSHQKIDFTVNSTAQQRLFLIIKKAFSNILAESTNYLNFFKINIELKF